MFESDSLTRSCVVLSLLLATPSLAGPDETTQFLLDDSASMLDIGILRTQMLLSNLKSGIVRYSWDDNRIYIYGSGTGVDVHTAEQGEKSCAEWVQSVRRLAGIGADGAPFAENSHIAENFSHYGFQRTSEPKDLYKRIDGIVSLDCWAILDDGATFSLTAPLLGTGYSIKKK